MFNISTYLEKFKKMEMPGGSVKKASESAIFECVGVRIKREEMDVVNGVLFVSAPSAIKNEIYMSKKAILEKVHKIVGETALKDIR